MLRLDAEGPSQGSVTQQLTVKGSPGKILEAKMLHVFVRGYEYGQTGICDVARILHAGEQRLFDFEIVRRVRSRRVAMISGTRC